MGENIQRSENPVYLCRDCGCEIMLPGLCGHCWTVWYTRVMNPEMIRRNRESRDGIAQAILTQDEPPPKEAR